MSPSLEAAIESARAREVPWNAERSARIEGGIASKRARRAMCARWARWALGGLASAALYAAVLHVSAVSREPLVSREEGASELRIEQPAPLSAASLGVAPEEVSLGERPVGDGGFE
jgi:hypothetical protein